MNTYTPPQGNTPQGQQLNTQQNMNTQAPQITQGMIQGDPNSFGTDQQLGNQLTTANANQLATGSSDNRQNMIADYGIPGMQGNYDQLAQQLFQYDSAVLNPKFGGGATPGIPGDAASYGRVDASPIALTPGALGGTAAQVMGMNNPKYAYSLQTDQANSIVNLLDNINSRISGQLGLAGTKYKNDVSNAQNAVDTVLKLMQMKQDAIDKANARGTTAADKTATLWQQLLDQSPTSYDLYKNIQAQKGQWASQGIDINQIWSNQRQLESVIGKGGAIPDSMRTSPLNKPLTAAQETLQNNVKSALSDLNAMRQTLKDHPDQLTLAALPGSLGARTFAAQRRNAMDVIARLRTGATMNPKEEKFYNQFVPELGDSQETINNKLDRLQAFYESFLSGKDLSGADPNAIDVKASTSKTASTVVMTGPDGKKWNVPANKVKLFKQNGYK